MITSMVTCFQYLKNYKISFEGQLEAITMWLVLLQSFKYYELVHWILFYLEDSQLKREFLFFYSLLSIGCNDKAENNCGIQFCSQSKNNVLSFGHCMAVAVLNIAVNYTTTWTHEKKFSLFQSLVILVLYLALWHSVWAPKSLSKQSDVGTHGQ